jgi:hypothetical protein
MQEILLAAAWFLLMVVIFGVPLFMFLCFYLQAFQKAVDKYYTWRETRKW